MTDQLQRDIESLDHLTRGVKEDAARAADKLGDTIGDLVAAIDHLGGIADDLLGRIEGLAERVAKLEGEGRADG
jgi:hypothetical protein